MKGIRETLIIVNTIATLAGIWIMIMLNLIFTPMANE